MKQCDNITFVNIWSIKLCTHWNSSITSHLKHQTCHTLRPSKRGESWFWPRTPKCWKYYFQNTHTQIWEMPKVKYLTILNVQEKLRPVLIGTIHSYIKVVSYHCIGTLWRTKPNMDENPVEIQYLRIWYGGTHIIKSCLRQQVLSTSAYI